MPLGARACSTSPGWRRRSIREAMLDRSQLPSYRRPRGSGALQCAACGAALPPGETISCAQCGATLAITEPGRGQRAVEELAPALRADAARPPPEVVKRRLEAIEADLPRRREWVAGMEAEADSAAGTAADRVVDLGRARAAASARVAATGRRRVWLLWRFWR